MSTRFSCGDTDTLVAYVYDEVDADTSDLVTLHLRTCGTCADDIAALGGVRRVLGEWTPPTPALRFSVVSEPSAPVRPAATAWQTIPRWAQLVAATLAIAVGASVANVQLRHDASGWTMTTGWMPVIAPVTGQTGVPAAANADWRPALVALEQSLRSELRARPSTPLVAPVASAAADPQALARVRTLIEESERRQQQQLALRLAQLGRDLDLQRRADLVRIDQGIGQLEGRTGAEVARQREMLNYIVRTSLRPQQ
jgi:hypothetical protein